jgi:histidinol phosphatase-like enzyme/predicted kinase
VNGVAEYCMANGIQLLAYRPVGGPERRRRVLTDAVLAELAARHSATPFEIALAWLTDLSPLIVPIPGPSRVETISSLARARDIALTEEDRARLDERVPAARRLRPGKSSLDMPTRDYASRSPGGPREAVPGEGAPRLNEEVVLVMGLPGAGKSTVARTFVERSYARLNRDEAGGSLGELIPALDRLIASGSSRIVLDNTYVSRKARAAVIETARQRGLAVRCLWLSTGVEDAQVNAATRIVSKYGRLLTPEEMRNTAKHDTAAFGPGVQFRYQRELEPPHASEGFARIDVMPFERVRDPSFVNRAVILWCDGVLRRSRSGQRTPSSADDVEVPAGRRDVLRRYMNEGWLLLGLSWQPEIEEETMTPAQVDSGFARMQELLGVTIEVEYCPHRAGPPTCWCRKPIPGLGVVFVQRHRLDPSRCIYVGAGAQDPGFARRLGFQYRDAADFFGSTGSRHLYPT